MSTVAVAAVCPPQYVTTSVAPVFLSTQKALIGSVAAVDKTLSATLKFYSERINGAVAVLVKQKAVAANQISEANRASAESVATSMKVLSTTERIKTARFDYGPEFGQGYNPCRVYEYRNLIANREGDMQAERNERVMSEVHAAPGRYADPIAAQKAMLDEHREKFCTQDQVNSGMCQHVGEMAGASLNAATLFEPAMESDKLNAAKVAFVNNLVGLPDAPLPPAAGTTVAAASYLLAKTRKDALMSPALASLKEIQLEYTGVETGHSGSDIPMAKRIQNEVTRYMGNNPEYKEWVKRMAAQNEHGLLEENLKMKALDLVIQEKQYRQYERMEAMLATLVASELNKQAIRANAAADKATVDDARQKIK